MENNKPLTAEEVVNLVCDEKDGLAMRLWKLIRHRNDAANQEDVPYHYMEVLTDDVNIVRTRQEIADVVRQYILQCEHCDKESILGHWHLYLVEGEELLRCPKCNGSTSRAQHKDSYALADILKLAPVPLADLFAEEMKIW